jgi:predicted transcriptional regulator
MGLRDVIDQYVSEEDGDYVPSVAKVLDSAEGCRSPEQVASATDLSIKEAEAYIQRLNQEGLLQDGSESYQVTEEGYELLDDRMAEENYLEDLWLAFAYASCNSPESDGSLNQDDLASKTDISIGKLRGKLKKAVKAGLLENKGRGQYDITEKGAQHVQQESDSIEEDLLYHEQDESFWEGLVQQIRARESVEETLKVEENKGLIEWLGKNEYRLTEKAAKRTGTETNIPEQLISYSEEDWTELKQRLIKKGEGFWPALAYTFRADSENSKNTETIIQDLVENMSGLESEEDLFTRIAEAESVGLIEPKADGYSFILDEPCQAVEEGFDFSEENVLYREQGEQFWRGIISVMSEKRDPDTREVLTVNEDLIILEGGKALENDLGISLEEGEEVHVLETGETSKWRQFDLVKTAEET